MENKQLNSIFLSEARKSARQQDWKLAVEKYRKFLNYFPNNSKVLVQYGHALKESGFINEAVLAYERAARLDDTYDIYLQLGRGLKSQGLTDRAALAFAHAVKLGSSDSSAEKELHALGYNLHHLPQPPKFIQDEEFQQKIYNEKNIKLFGSRFNNIIKNKKFSSLDEVLYVNHLTKDFVHLFDGKYYFDSLDIGKNYEYDLNYLCIIHFILYGIDKISPINAEMAFDKEFYEENYRTLFRISDADLYRYWINFGIKHKQAPNETISILSKENFETDLFLNSIDYNFFKECKGSFPDECNKSEIIKDFISGGFLETTAVLVPNEKTAQLYKSIADRARIKGNLELSVSILEHILTWLPDDYEAIQSLGDRYYDLERYLNASWCYEKIIASNKEDRWVLQNLAGAYARMRRYKDAYDLITKASIAYPQYPMIREKRNKIIDDFFIQSVKDYESLSSIDRISEGQDIIDEYCKSVSEIIDESFSSHKKIKSVALYSLLDLKQCKFYRVDQKLEQLKSAGFEAEVFDSNKDLDKFLSSIDKFDAVIFYRLAPLPNIVPAIMGARRAGLVTFYEIDDLLFLRKDYPGSFESYAGQIDRATYNMLAMGVPLFARAMSMCDYGIASTPTLAREMKPFVQKGIVYVHRNGLGSDHERYIEYQQIKRENFPVTIFYGSGTKAHKQDFVEILEPALLELANKFGEKVKFVLMGWLPISDTFRKAAGANLTLLEPVWDIHGYWSIMRACDINVAILKPSLNVDCKSEIKWIEAALFGIPSVVSRTATYEEVIEEGRSGFMCDTVADWVQALEALVKDADLRRRVGLVAQDYIRKNYTIEKMGENLRNIFDSIPCQIRNENRKKVLIVNVFYAPQMIGGATRVVHDNVKYINKNYGDKFEIEVFTAIDEAEIDYKVNTYCNEGIRVTGVTRSVAGEVLYPYEDKRMGEIFKNHLETFKPDLVHFHCIQRLSLSVVNETRKADIPYIITAHDGWWISDNQFIIDKFGESCLYDYLDPISVLNKFGRDSFSRMQALQPALFSARNVLSVSRNFGKIYRQCGLPNVIDIENGVSDISVFDKIPSEDGRVRIAHIGGMVKHKGFHLFREAVQNNSYENIRIILVDHSKPSGYIYESIWGTTPVTIIGKVKQKDMGEIYRQIDVLVAPSIWPESFGLVTREALINNCWVIGSDRGAISENISEGKNGHIVDVSSAAGISSILRKIDLNKDVYLSSPVHQAVIKTADEQGEELISLYENIIFGSVSP
ncbi:hypothetical protein CFR76_11255 [Komagataeibacter swingsii]|uniref:Glycosyl transferase family 1 n=2 Tax=Komagataeibacter swingsii TaxID=215220 RepID=A0A2V4S269_9PROT|nr:hypothetical protein CFR76_11255 [Komagataeibacter swingsii]